MHFARPVLARLREERVGKLGSMCLLGLKGIAWKATEGKRTYNTDIINIHLYGNRHPYDLPYIFQIS